VRQTAQTDEESEKVEPEATTPAGVEGRESEAVSTTSADEAEAGTDEEGVATSVSDTVVAEAETSDSGADDIDLTDDELAAMASEMLSEVVRLMGFNAEVVTSWREDTDDDGSRYLLLDIEGQDLGALIGRRGETLASLQYLVRLMVNQRIKRWRNIVVDVENYKERREAQLTQLALRMADQVTDSGRAMALEPMPPNERRLVHIALRDHPTVYTQSSGEDERRKVNIVPKDTVGA
jgi:spoIIIJ-associated protein